MEPATANNRYRSLASLFKWLEEEGEIRTSPHGKDASAQGARAAGTVLSDDALRLLLKACAGKHLDSGVRQMLKRRAQLAGIGHVHPHQLRYTFARCWLAQGGTEGDLMRLAG